MVNNEPFPGGECLWRGCIPSKAWRAAADVIRNRAHDAEMGVDGTNTPKLNWEQVEKHRRWVQSSRGEMALKADKGMKIDVREGYGEFVDAHTLKITPVEGEPYTVSFGAAVIATGAPAFVPPIPGARENLASGGVVTSDTIWNLASPPKKLGIVGGGVIGVEMAQIFRDFGTEVLMLERHDRILAEIEEEIGKVLIASLEKEITVVTGADIKEVERQARRDEAALCQQGRRRVDVRLRRRADGHRQASRHQQAQPRQGRRRTRRRGDQGQHALPDQRAAHLRGGRRDRRLHAGPHRRHAGPRRRRQPARPRAANTTRTATAA